MPSLLTHRDRPHAAHPRAGRMDERRKGDRRRYDRRAADRRNIDPTRLLTLRRVVLERAVTTAEAWIAAPDPAGPVTAVDPLSEAVAMSRDLDDAIARNDHNAVTSILHTARHAIAVDAVNAVYTDAARDTGDAP